MTYLNAENRALLKRTKVWSEGVVQAAGLEDGVIWVEVSLVPDEHQVTCEFAPLCPGFFRLPKSGEEVLCAFVDGDRNTGYVVGHTGPDSFSGEVEEGTLYVWAPDGEKVVIQATGKGEVEISAPLVLTKCDQAIVDSSDIRLGGATASDPLVRESRLKTEFSKFLNGNYKLHQHMQVLPLLPAGQAPTTPGAPVGAETATQLGNIGADKIKGD